jgi:hypothetical protein
MQSPQEYNVDVVIAGGGVAGAAAAISAARNGLRAILLESRESLGGLATNGYVNGVAGMIEGICKEWLQRLRTDGALVDTPHTPAVDPEKGKLALEQMALQAGARIIYGVTVTDCAVENNRIERVIGHSRSGRMEFKAKYFIDATGDAVLAACAGVPCEVGSPEFGGLNMSTTLAFRMANVDLTKYREAASAWAADPERNPEKLPPMQFYRYLERQAVASGDLPFFIFPAALIYQVAGTSEEDADICLMTTHSMYCRNTDVEDVTRQILEQHQQILWVESFLRKCAPGFDRSRVTSIANLHGIRDSRRAMGEYVLKDTDVALGARFPDGIARFPEFFDTHHPTSREDGFMRHIHVAEPVDSPFCRPAPGREELMHPFVNQSGYELRVNSSSYCEIPYRCLVPLDIENMFMAGRCLSAEFHAQAAVRIISVCMTTGQAAGVAAALCLRNGVTPRELDGKLVRETMIEQGVEVDKEPDGYWADVRHRIKQALEDGGPVRVLPGDFIDFVKTE